MSFKSTFLAGIATLAMSLPALAGAPFEIHDSYARSSNTKAGAAFLMIHNHGKEDDRLIGAASDVAARVQLHTHIEDDNGVMQMRHVEEGFVVPADGMLEMARGGKHIMFMGLNAPFEQGDFIPVTLIFEKAGEIEIRIEVDQERKASEAAGHTHEHSSD